MLKKFKDTKDFIKDIGLSRSTVHFKTGLYEIFKKNPVFKNWKLSSHYFENLFKMINSIFKSNAELFS